MLFNTSKKSKEKKENIEKKLHCDLDSQKKDLLILQRMREKNTMGAFYDERFIQNVNKESKKNSKSFKLVHTKQNGHEITIDYLQKKFATKNAPSFILPKRSANVNIQNNFSLQIQYNKNETDKYENDFYENEVEESEQDNQDLLLEKIDDDLNSDQGSETYDDDEIYQYKEEEFKFEQQLSKIKKNVSMEIVNSIHHEENKTKEIVYIQTTNNDSNNIFYYKDEINDYILNGLEIKNNDYSKIKKEIVYDIPQICYTTWHTKNLPPLMEKNFTSLQKKK